MITLHERINDGRCVSVYDSQQVEFFSRAARQNQCRAVPVVSSADSCPE